ncbi:MAG: hypothetical protein A2293_13335 [Elusimicrobia bacterium RIFOXYB2_FULL_49_7]|nr:MAG: hypothetical protein A2293_13335 [Elusimicrobia bacterium RIFOXYB2_FULL_49_7]
MKINNQKGFTLTETIVAMVLFSIVAVPVSIFFTKMAVMAKEGDRIIAIAYAESVLDETLLKSGEAYDYDKTVQLSAKPFRVVRSISERDQMITISVKIYQNTKTLAELKGFKPRG